MEHTENNIRSLPLRIPSGVEILLKKASVDPNFRKLLLCDSEKAAQSIELKLDDAELAMLKAASKEQLAQIIDQTEVPDQLRRGVIKASTALAIVAILAGAGAGVYFFGGKVIQWVENELFRAPSYGVRPDGTGLDDEPF